MNDSGKRDSQETSKSGNEDVIRDVRDMDVIMGRASLDSFHNGTVQLLAAIDASIPEYARAVGRADKTRIIKDLYRHAAIHGRFLTRHETISDAYIELSESAARVKISHIIRYRQRNNPDTSTVEEPPDSNSQAYDANAQSRPVDEQTSSSLSMAPMSMPALPLHGQQETGAPQLTTPSPSSSLSAFEGNDIANSWVAHNSHQLQNSSLASTPVTMIHLPTLPTRQRPPGPRLSSPSNPFAISEGEELIFWATYHSQLQQQVILPPRPPGTVPVMTPSPELEELFPDVELLSVLGNLFDPD